MGPREAGPGTAPARQEDKMKTDIARRMGVAVAALAALFGTTAFAGTNSESQTVTQVGATAVLYRGPQVNVVISDRFARYNPTGNWLLLDTAMTATGDPIGIPRGAIAVRTPDGEVVPLATQAQFERAYPQLTATVMRANVSREPLGYLIPQRYRPMRLFAPHGIGVVWDSVWLDQFHNSFGRLYFHLPFGVQKGPYALLIHLKEHEIVIPFTV
jgi:hypothetical protein